MADYHEPPGELPPIVRDYHRALTSLREEIEAIDWYQQRIAVTQDQQLASILAHNRDEEMEHACLSLEWLRRNMPGWDERLHKLLFTTGDMVAVEEQDGGGAGAGPRPHGLGIGSLKGE